LKYAPSVVARVQAEICLAHDELDVVLADLDSCAARNNAPLAMIRSPILPASGASERKLSSAAAVSSRVERQAETELDAPGPRVQRSRSGAAAVPLMAAQLFAALKW
jgi:hypothetical protein